MARGRDGYVRLKFESAYDSFPASGMTGIGFNSEGFVSDKEHGDANNITSNPTKDATFVTKDFTRWALAGVCNYNQLNHLVGAMLTAIDETTPIAAEAGTSSKIYRPSITKKSLSAEVSKGNIPASKVNKFSGNIIGDLEFAWEQKDRKSVV